MARYFQGKSGPGRVEWPGKKKIRPEEPTQDTPEEEEEKEEESDFVHTLSPKQKAEYDSLDKEQKTLVKYVLGVPGVDVSKIDLSGNKQKESSAASASPLPLRREDKHSGSGKSFGLDTGGRTKTATGNGGTGKKRYYEDSFLKETSSSADRATGFTYRSGSISSEGSGGGTRMNTNQAVNYLQSLQDEERRKSANPALVGALAAGVRGRLAPSAPEKKDKQTVWQRALNTFLGGLKNSAAGITDAARTLYEAGQGGRTRDMQDLRDSAARGLEMAERQLAYLREHPEAGDAETAQYSVDHFKRQVDAYDKVLNENIQQRAAQQTAKLADDLQLSAQKDIDKAKEGLGWLGRGMVDAGASFAQMAGDGLLGVALGPGGGTLPFLARSFGSGTMEARQGGGTLDQQLLNGGLFAGVELLTEKLSSAALPFKAVYGDGNPALERKLDDLVTQAVRKFSASPTGQRILGGALSAGKSFITEGLEEFVGDWLEWQLPRLYGGDVNSFSDQLASSLNSFFTGGLTGLFGAAFDPGTYGYESSWQENNFRPKTPQQQYLERFLRENGYYVDEAQGQRIPDGHARTNTPGSIDFSDRYGNIGRRFIQGGLDPNSSAATAHASLYYDSVRKMNTDTMHIAHNTGMSEQDITDIKKYVFFELHDLGESAPQRFDPSFEMAQSWQRLIEGKNIQPHDITLLKHELLERRLVLEGLTQSEAHIRASAVYNYSKEIRDYYGKIGKHQEE